MIQNQIIPIEVIERKIFLIRGEKVMLDKDLAALYNVKPIRLREQVKRNRSRFPEDFMFQLTDEETEILLSQFAIPSRKHLGGFNPYAFTEQGIAMLSSVLNSERAILVNIAVIRAFVKLRKLLINNQELATKFAELEKKYDAQFKIVFDALRQLIQPPEKPKRPIGFRVEEPKAIYKTKRR